MRTNSRPPEVADAARMLAIVEAAYAVDATNHDWASGLLAAVADAIGAGTGGFACTFRRDDAGGVVFAPASVVWRHVPGSRVSQKLQDLSANPPSAMAKRSGRGRAALSVLSDASSIELIALDGRGRGVLMSFGIGRSSEVASRARPLLDAMAAHLLAALRLRGRLDDASDRLDVAPACSGCPLAHKPERPVGRAMTMTKAEQTVVSALARGSSTKETAYWLGVSDSTVRVLLMRAARRAGASSRRELVQIWRRGQVSGPHGTQTA